jgi:prolyl-tRNA synthetase
MFSDADLLGVPIRVIISPRNIKEDCCEIVTRNKTIKQKVALNDIAGSVKKMLCEMSGK